MRRKAALGTICDDGPDLSSLPSTMPDILLHAGSEKEPTCTATKRLRHVDIIPVAVNPLYSSPQAIWRNNVYHHHCRLSSSSGNLNSMNRCMSSRYLPRKKKKTTMRSQRLPMYFNHDTQKHYVTCFYHLTSFGNTIPTQVLITISSSLVNTKSLETLPSTPGSTKSY